MTNAKHTPGPWKLMGPSVYANGSVDTVSCSVLVPIASTEDTCNFDQEGRCFTVSGSQLANARLIAAAPELLAELDVRVGDLVMLRKAIVAGDPKDELLFRIDDMLRETRTAIAKAEGRDE